MVDYFRPNTSCALNDWLTSRPGGCWQPRELWFSDTVCVHIKFTFYLVLVSEGVGLLLLTVEATLKDFQFSLQLFHFGFVVRLLL